MLWSALTGLVPASCRNHATNMIYLGWCNHTMPITLALIGLKLEYLQLHFVTSREPDFVEPSVGFA